MAGDATARLTAAALPQCIYDKIAALQAVKMKAMLTCTPSSFSSKKNRLPPLS
jgi:hypothetical protein